MEQLNCIRVCASRGSQLRAVLVLPEYLCKLAGRVQQVKLCFLARDI